MRYAQLFAPATAAALLSLVCATQNAHAGLEWKWRTPDGHCCIYSDKPPPPSVADKDILLRPSNARRQAAAPQAAPDAASAVAAASSPAGKASDPELEARRKKDQAAKDAARKAEEEKLAQQRTENCQRARDYQRTLDSGMRIASTNAKGEREIMDDKARAQEYDRTRQSVEANCK